MKIYSFFSGDTEYITRYSSLKKAQARGREVMEHYLNTCRYLGEEPEADEKSFIPDEVNKITKDFARLLAKDPNTFILEDEVEEYLK